jgi:hypothetical protein
VRHDADIAHFLECYCAGHNLVLFNYQR